MRTRSQVPLALVLSVPLVLAASAACAGSRGVRAPEAAGGAYGTTDTRSRSRLTNRVGQAEIERAGGMNLGAFIESHLAGVRVLSSNGEFHVIISGASFQSNVGALILIDGTEASLAGLRLYDVSAIEVLKDTAAAIYGVRGANGVLLVTTRKK